jgi:hypothetical protein
VVAVSTRQRLNFRIARDTLADSTGVTPTGARSGIITPNYASHFRHKTGAV